MKHSIKLLPAITLLSLTQLDPALAGSHTWSGAASGLWSVPGNWSAGGAPASGESPLNLTFPPGATRLNSTNDVTGLQVDSLTFSDFGYTLYALAGRTLTLKGGTNIVCGDNNTLDTSLGLVLANTNYISVAANKQLTVMGAMGGTGSLGKVGPGQLTLSGTPANTYAGSTLVIGGSLVLQRGVSVFNPAIAVPGPLIIGDANGALGSVVTTLNFQQQIANSAPITILYSGVLDISVVGQTVASLTMIGGTVQGAPTSLLTLRGDVTAGNYTNSADISCAISLGGTNRTFDVKGNYGLNINGSISDGGSSVGLVKTGSGLLLLSASNSYAGLTVVSTGMLQIQNPFALGSTSAGTIVSNGASLRFGQNFAVGAEPLTLYGLGANAVGSVYADFYTNSWAGPVQLASNARVNVLGAVGRLAFTGPITGPGGLDKLGAGTLSFAGTATNSYAGATTVSLGRLELNKTNAPAISGSLFIGDNVTPTNNASVLVQRADQIGDSVSLTVNSSGALAFDPFNAPSETIGSLAGSGSVNLVLTKLTIGGNNSDTSFDGLMTGFNGAQIVKTGLGTWTLNGTNSAGSTIVNAGKLVVNGVSSGPMQVNFLSSLGGTGVLGSVTGTLAHLAPGNSVGKITTGNLVLMNGSSSLDIQLNGTAPGTGYDQVIVNGSVNLTNPTLIVSMGFAGAVGNQYVLIANDGLDDVAGAFKNLPEGATLTSGAVQFKISYKGGDGNDVALTQMTLPTPPQVSGLTLLANGQISLNGTGFAASAYDIEGNLDLNTANWVKLGTVQADQNGAIHFIDTDAPNHSMRFYRFKLE